MVIMDNINCWLDGHTWEDVSIEHYQYLAPILDDVSHDPIVGMLIWGSQLMSLKWISDLFITKQKCERCDIENEVKDLQYNCPPVKYYYWARMSIPNGRIVLPAGYIKSKCGKYFEPSHE